MRYVRSNWEIKQCQLVVGCRFFLCLFLFVVVIIPIVVVVVGLLFNIRVSAYCNIAYTAFIIIMFCCILLSYDVFSYYCRIIVQFFYVSLFLFFIIFFFSYEKRFLIKLQYTVVLMKLFKKNKVCIGIVINAFMYICSIGLEGH